MTISANIIADSVSPDGIRLTTLQCRYPKFIHGEFMTHRVFSRNASSSRAIPVERLIKDVMEDPAMPIHWGKNQRGMQAREALDVYIKDPWHPGHIQKGQLLSPEHAWLRLRDKAVDMAQAYNEAGYHKQIVNRLLEPFCHINVVFTATEFSNFFALRDHPDAQPEIRELAQRIKEAMEGSTPIYRKPDEWHLPYITKEEWVDLLSWASPEFGPARDRAIKLSVARCARVSYLTQEGKKPTIEEDLALYDRLVTGVPLHASPAEHQGTPGDDPKLWGNFKGWIQYRKTLSGECQ
jgi:hypothetical protein